MKIKNILGSYEGRHSRKRGQLGQGTNKNMALFGSQKVIEYDLCIGWRGEGCHYTVGRALHSLHNSFSFFLCHYFHGMLCVPKVIPVRIFWYYANDIYFILIIIYYLLL